MLGEEILDEFVALAELPTSFHDRDVPISGFLAFVRVESSSAKVIFLESGLYLKIPKKWLIFFSGLAEWGMGRLPKESFIRDMAELCYGITIASTLDPIPLFRVLRGSSEEFREWGKGEFEPLEVVTANKTRLL